MLDLNRAVFDEAFGAAVWLVLALAGTVAAVRLIQSVLVVASIRGLFLLTAGVVHRWTGSRRMRRQLTMGVVPKGDDAARVSLALSGYLAWVERNLSALEGDRKPLARVAFQHWQVRNEVRLVMNLRALRRLESDHSLFEAFSIDDPAAMERGVLNVLANPRMDADPSEKKLVIDQAVKSGGATTRSLAEFYQTASAGSAPATETTAAGER